MHGIQDLPNRCSPKQSLAVSAQDIAEGATSQAAAVEELVPTVSNESGNGEYQVY